MTEAERGRLFSVIISEPRALSAYFLPFIVGGGLFLPTTCNMPISSQVCLIIHLAHEDRTVVTSGRVVWKIPANAQANRRQGLGVQLVNADPALVQLVDCLLCEDDAQLPDSGIGI